MRRMDPILSVPFVSLTNLHHRTFSDNMSSPSNPQPNCLLIPLSRKIISQNSK
jgi:hypothetical protein